MALNIERLKQAKKEQHLSYDDLAKMTGYSKSTITNIFCGYISLPRWETIQALERALGLAPEWTDEEKALGVGKTAVVLSDQDEYRLTLLARADEVLGEDYTKAYLYALEIAIQQNLSK